MLEKYKGNPILKPEKGIRHEELGVLNPGAWRKNGVTYLLYRAAGEAPDYKICLGLAESRDGFNFTRREKENPVLFPEEGSYDGGCIEDARIVELEGVKYVTYACRPYAPGAYWEKDGLRGAPKDAPEKFKANLTMTALAKTENFIDYERLGVMVGGDVDDRDVFFFPERINGKYAILRRPAEWCGSFYPNEKPGIWISFSDNCLKWNQNKLLASSKYTWEEKKIGGGTPPVKTEAGWLIIYHGVDSSHVYRAGMMMLDLKDPEKIIARHPDPILEPEKDFEKEGVFPNVVFPTGTTLHDKKLFVYYGAADRVCCVATTGLDSLVNELMNHTI
jgi:predicted GH43/DUF377 family glycosyl hydrolase